MATFFNNQWHQNPLAAPPIHQMIDTSSHNTESYRDSSGSSYTSDPSTTDNGFLEFPVVPSSVKTTYVLPDAMGKDIISKHSRIRASLYLDSNVHVAGGSIKGRLELVCMSEKLKIGKILVELIGFEDIVDKGNSKSNATQHKVFMVKPFFIQDTDLPPTEAVDMTSKPDGDGHWNAVKGRNTFEFEITANEELPSSFMSRWASVRYIVACSVHIKIPSTARKQILKIHRETTLVETVPEHLQYSVPAQGFASQQLFMGGKNVLGLECRMHKTLWNSGSPIYVEAILRNETKKRVVAIKTTLIRRLNTFSRQEDKLHPVVFAKKTVNEVRVDKNTWGGVGKGEERRIVLEVPVPVDIRTISKAELVDVTYAVQICVSSALSPDTVVEIPVKIVHPLSVSRPPYLMHKIPKAPETMRHHRASHAYEDAFDRERNNKKVKEAVTMAPAVVASAPYLHDEEMFEEIIDEPIPECRPYTGKNFGNWTSSATVFESTPTTILTNRSNEPKEADADIHAANAHSTTFTLPAKPNHDVSRPLGSKRMRPPPPPPTIHSKPTWLQTKQPDSSTSIQCIPENVPSISQSPISMAQHNEGEEKESRVALPPPDVKITLSPAKVASLSRQSSLAIPPIATRHPDYQDDAHSSVWSGRSTDGESSSRMQTNLTDGEGSNNSSAQPIERPDWPSNETLGDISNKHQDPGSEIVNEGEDEISIAKKLNTMFSGFLPESHGTDYPVHQQPVAI